MVAKSLVAPPIRVFSSEKGEFPFLKNRSGDLMGTPTVRRETRTATWHGRSG
jgi:hypothetical protein